MPRRNRRNSIKHALGMSLVEVLVSTVIFAIGILGLLSANATAFSSFSDAKYRIDAALLADRLLGEIWVDRANVALYAHAAGYSWQPYDRIAPWMTDVTRLLPAGDASVAVAGASVTVTVTWQPRNAQLHQHVATAFLQEP